MNKAEFWVFARAVLIRAIRTICQTAVALIGINAVGVTDVDWVGVASSAALAGIISVLTSVAAGLPEVPPSQYMDGGAA